MDSTIGAIVTVAVIGGLAAGLIASSRLGGGAGTFLGFFFFGACLPLIGIIVACVMRPPVLPPDPPGWYADPWQPSQWRYWDGYQWTWQTAQATEAESAR